MILKKNLYPRIKAANGFLIKIIRWQPLSVGAIFLMNLTNANAQSASRRQDYIRIMPVYQRWSQGQGTQLAQLSVPVYVRLALGRNMNVAARGGQANVNGDNTQKVNGLTDTQLSFNYSRGAFIYNFGVNFPSGKRKLTYDEFLTTALLSLNHYSFYTPSFGQGLNVTPGLTWAFSLSENLALGLGASYQYKGKFKPVAFIGDYDPGNEVLLTGGVDWRLGEAAKFSWDVIYTLYGIDKLDSNQVFAAGNRFVMNAQFQQSFNFDQLSVFVRFLSRGKNSLAVGGALLPEVDKAAPEQIEFIAQYFHRFNPRFAVIGVTQGRFFTKPATATLVSSAGIALGSVGVIPEISLSPRFKIPARFIYWLGRSRRGQDFVGMEVGLGMTASF